MDISKISTSKVLFYNKKDINIYQHLKLLTNMKEINRYGKRFYTSHVFCTCGYPYPFTHCRFLIARNK